jgi:hypothetical protein
MRAFALFHSRVKSSAKLVMIGAVRNAGLNVLLLQSFVFSKIKKKETKKLWRESEQLEKN